MPTVFVYHDVKDKDHWLASPKREEFLVTLGVTNTAAPLRPAENPTRVGGLDGRLGHGTAVMGAMKTEAAAEAMASDGAIMPETLVILVEGRCRSIPDSDRLIGVLIHSGVLPP